MEDDEEPLLPHPQNSVNNHNEDERTDSKIHKDRYNMAHLLLFAWYRDVVAVEFLHQCRPILQRQAEKQRRRLEDVRERLLYLFADPVWYRFGGEPIPNQSCVQEWTRHHNPGHLHHLFHRHNHLGEYQHFFVQGL